VRRVAALAVAAHAADGEAQDGRDGGGEAVAAPAAAQCLLKLLLSAGGAG
jgi:hypothetical protein